MLDWLHDLSDWVEGFADSPWAVAALAANSFSDALFFPIPPDPLMIAISLPQPHLAIWLALLTTAASVAGAVAGYWLGRRFGRPVLRRFASADSAQRVEGMFERYGAWAVILAAITPLPYKVFAISAGVLDMDLRRFILASLIGRGVRFFALAALIMVFGESVNSFLDSNIEEAAIVGVACIVAGAASVMLLRRRLGKGAAHKADTEAPRDPD